MNYQSRVIVITLTVAMLAIGWVMVQRFQSEQISRDPSSYLPAEVAYAIQVPKALLAAWERPEFSNVQRLAPLGAAATEQWHDIETQLSRSVSEVIWYETRGEQRNWRGLIARLAHPLARNEKRGLDSLRPVISWASSEPAQVIIYDSLTVGFEPADMPEVGRLREPLFEANDDITIYATADIVSELLSDQLITDAEGTLMRSAVTPGSALRIAVDVIGEGVRVRRQGTAEQGADNAILDVPAIPSDARFVFGGPSRIAGTLPGEGDPFTRVREALVRMIASRSFVSDGVVQEGLKSFSAALATRDTWLLAGTSEEAAQRFAGELTAWSAPVIREETLSDRTTFREYKKGTPTSTPMTAFGYPITIWGPEGRPGAQKLYVLTKGQNSYLTNSEPLLALQAWQDNASVKDNFLSTCFENDRHGMYNFLAVFSEKNASDTTDSGLTELRTIVTGSSKSADYYCFGS